jgi:hypothetical protein
MGTSCAFACEPEIMSKYIFLSDIKRTKSNQNILRILENHSFPGERIFL